MQTSSGVLHYRLLIHLFCRILFLSLSHKYTHTFGLLRFYEALTIFSAILYFEIVLSNLSCYSFSWMSIWWNIWRRPTTILPIIVCWTLNMLINQNDKIFHGVTLDLLKYLNSKCNRIVFFKIDTAIRFNILCFMMNSKQKNVWAES